METQQKIFKYTQVYDYLKNIKFVEYLSNKRDDIHKQLFENAIEKLIKEVNNPKTTCKIAKAIQAQIELYEFYLRSQLSVDELLYYVNDEDKKFRHKYSIADFNKDNFRFVEYKNKIWHYPSNVSIIYTHSLVKNKYGNSIRLIIGPLFLGELWDNDYLLNKDINKILKQDNTAKYVIEYIDYVGGYVVLYDKVNFTTISVDLDYLQNVNKYEFSHTYDEMFTVKRNKQNKYNVK